ncbi:cytochrome c oxidase accessory protein CcoG [Methylophilus aquaticus]|uniref:Cytochrome c oxidase accessory protein CcoG n=1 Tax=Methylophilus aquaticus TaxID=1971610 RepID=A0ABT9JS37_9PROT|nr:cytochrome c oxidase accessory protein CcoG [Methylophilus aquaticus]MDP8567392.1 cytochrome c oxidase accessory protein CcoG [Methylophilus aquaticus]
MSSPRNHPVIPIVATPATEQTISLYQKTQKIYPRTLSGYYKNWRWAMIWLTQLVFYGLPWLQHGDRQAFLLDIGAHRFYLFGLVIYPQDLFYLALLLIICALALFLFTAVAGRLWCGFSCPQSVYTEIFLWMERKIEGDRLARIKLDQPGITVRKARIKLSKHGAWLAFSLITGFTFVGYFTPVRELFAGLQHMQLGGWEWFWLGFYSLATYGNAGFLREQVCKHMCPYARFQSAMFDNNTLIVAYDSARGEPRGSRSKDTDPQKQGLGACVDCNICVQVCPTGIDIRNGLQYECISCGLCIDACDQVMDKMQYPRGLIKFATADGKAMQATWRHLLRPRVLIYTALLLVISAVFAYSLASKPGFMVDIMRDRNIMYRETNEGVENLYQLHLSNATETTQHYQIQASGLAGLSVQSEQQITLTAAGEALIPLSIRLTHPEKTGSQQIRLEVTAHPSGETVVSKTTFYSP